MAGLLAAVCAAPVAAQPDPARDLHDLLALVESVHPDPYRYVSEAVLAGRAEREAELLDAMESATDLDVARGMHRVLSLVGDSHFAVALPSFQPGVRPGPFLLPMLPRKVGERILVDASIPAFPRGTELIELQGQPIEDVWTELSSLALVDGDRPAARRARVERDFTLHFHLGFGTDSTYSMRVRLPDGEEQIIALDPVTPTELGALSRGRVSAPSRGAPPQGLPAYPWLVDAPRGAKLLRMPTFGVADQAAYRDRVDALFASLQGAEPLVLDLRGNDGGFRTNGIAVLEHLIDGDYAQWVNIATRTREIPGALRARVTFPFSAPDVLATFPGERAGELWRFEGDPFSDQMRGSKPHHAGPVVVFADDATNSAAVEMIVALRAARADVVVIGTETIGECGRHIGEIPILFTGRTDVRVLMSVAAIEHVPTRGCEPGRGVVPDVEVRYSEADFMEGVDPFVALLRTVLER
ncbi:MAG: S41 family peptidase [Gemmatimonadota bacterium]